MFYRTKGLSRAGAFVLGLEQLRAIGRREHHGRSHAGAG